MRHWEELNDIIDKNGGPKEPYIMKSMFKCTFEPAELEEENMGLYTHGQMIMDPIHGQISYNCCLSNAFKLKHGHDVKRFLVGIKRAPGKDIAQHAIRAAKVIPVGRVMARCVQLLIITPRLWKVLRRVEERMERRMVGKKMILVLM